MGTMLPLLSSTPASDHANIQAAAQALLAFEQEQGWIQPGQSLAH
jgi:hypothetical protein